MPEMLTAVGRELPAARARRLDDRRRHPQRRLRRRAPSGHRRETARSSPRSSTAARPRSSASTARRAASACSPPTPRWRRSTPTTSSCSVASWGFSGGSRRAYMHALALPAPDETLARAINEALAPARATQVRDGALGGRCLVCGGLTRIVAHAGIRSATCMDCESVLEATSADEAAFGVLLAGDISAMAQTSRHDRRAVERGLVRARPGARATRAARHRTPRRSWRRPASHSSTTAMRPSGAGRPTASRRARRTPRPWRPARPRPPSACASRWPRATGRSCSAATARWASARSPGTCPSEGRVGLVYLDLHADLNTPDTRDRRRARLDGRRAPARRGRARRRSCATSGRARRCSTTTRSSCSASTRRRRRRSERDASSGADSRSCPCMRSPPTPPAPRPRRSRRSRGCDRLVVHFDVDVHRLHRRAAVREHGPQHRADAGSGFRGARRGARRSARQRAHDHRAQPAPRRRGRHDADDLRREPGGRARPCARAGTRACSRPRLTCTNGARPRSCWRREGPDRL